MGRAIAAHLMGAVLLFITWASLGVLLADLLGRRPPHQPFFYYYLFWLLLSLPWSIFLYLLLLGSISAFTYYREARERESQQARLAAQLAEARLGALRMQLNPHFLFNSLNAITVLVRDQKTREASRMLELLSGILRQVLQSERPHEIPLAQELQFLEQYLAIEQVRFPDRLQIVWSIQPAVREVLVPEFILQPLVENAVRHGVAKLSDTGTVEIAARESEGYLILTVQDNGPGYYPTSAAGVGLRNTQARLETLFGTDADLQVRNVEGGGTIASVRLPLRRESDG
jgi:LytS/YehU family sensor histidine kinase